LHEYFEVVVTAGDVSIGKPDPEPYLLTAKKLGAKPHECLVIEDSENGVRSAKAAGMICIAISNTEKLDKLKLADKTVNGYSEITEGLIDGFLKTTNSSSK
jgi:beta-phosphoglucomutase